VLDGSHTSDAKKGIRNELQGRGSQLGLVLLSVGDRIDRPEKQLSLPREVEQVSGFDGAERAVLLRRTTTVFEDDRGIVEQKASEVVIDKRSGDESIDLSAQVLFADLRNRGWFVRLDHGLSCSNRNSSPRERFE